MVFLHNSYETGTFVYPNPTSGRVTIDLGDSSPETVVKVQDIGGRLVNENLFTNRGEFEIDVDGSPGVYFINLQSGIQKAVVKVIKK